MNTVLKSVVLTVAPLALLASSQFVAAGNTADKLADLGYLCFNAGPSNWTHCLREDKFGHPAVPIKVFSEDGSEFKGTEQLLRYDVYHGQPCPQDDLDQWDFLVDPPYFACHEFYTGHH
jgi:hypothetical protein